MLTTVRSLRTISLYTLGMSSTKTFVVIPNWNGQDSIAACLDSLQHQSHSTKIIVVDNASSDNSVQLIEDKYPNVTLLRQNKNWGFAGGVNIGIRHAIKNDADYVALLNNDASVDTHWLHELTQALQANKDLGIATGKIMDTERKHLDSTGEFYTIWGLPFPRGRGEPAGDQYDHSTEIFAASGGASLYRVSMLKRIGLFDESFFAYYEDVDLSFRAQLAGWKVTYVPAALAYHQIGASSQKIKGFTTYQTMKNLPALGRKNIPLKLLPKILPRAWFVYTTFYWSAVARGQGWPATKGLLMAFVNIPRNFRDRWKIQKNRQVPVDYINKMLVHDLPPEAIKLRALRKRWWKLTGRSNG